MAISFLSYSDIDSTKAANLVKVTERTSNTSFGTRWAFSPVADYPVEMMKKVKTPDLSKGKVYCCKEGVGGVIWVYEDTACILIKTWNSKSDTTYKFLWFMYNKNKFTYLK